MLRITRVVLTGLWVSAAWSVAGVAGALTVPGFSAPGIGSPGYPDFAAASFDVSLKKSGQSGGSGFTLTITGDDPNGGIFNFKNAYYKVGDEEIELTAHFDSTGHLLTSQPNTIEIFGKLPASKKPTEGKAPTGYSWSKQHDELLFEAVLTGVAVDSKHEALGFSTGTFSGWADQPQFVGTGANPTGSLWLYSIFMDYGDNSGGVYSSFTHNKTWDKFLSEIANDTSLHNAKFQDVGSIVSFGSTATVPLPPAGLLMLGALAGLGGFARRRRAAAVV